MCYNLAMRDKIDLDERAKQNGYLNFDHLAYTQLGNEMKSPQDIATLLKVSPRTIYNRIRGRHYNRRNFDKVFLGDVESPKPQKVFISEIDREIVLDLAHGRIDAEIGKARGLAESTVKQRVFRLLRKFGVENRTHLVAVFISSDIIQTHDLFRHFDIHVTEYIRGKIPKRFYRLDDIRGL